MAIGPGAAFMGHKYLSIRPSAPYSLNKKQKGKGPIESLIGVLSGKGKKGKKLERGEMPVIPPRFLPYTRVPMGGIARRRLVDTSGKKLERRDLRPGDLLYDPRTRTYIDPFRRPIRPGAYAPPWAHGTTFRAPEAHKETWAERAKKAEKFWLTG